MFVGIGAVVAFAVEHSRGGWQPVVGRVVVADDEVDAERLGVCHFVDGFDAAVECNNQRETIVVCVVDGFVRNAVTLVVAVGNVEIECVGVVRQKCVHQRHGCRAIDIVIAVDENFFFLRQGVVEPIHGFVHVFNQKRVVQVV